MTDSLKTRRVKLGMTVEGPRKRNQYDRALERMGGATKEPEELEEQANRIMTGRRRQAIKGQSRIPKAKPGKKGSTYA